MEYNREILNNQIKGNYARLVEQNKTLYQQVEELKKEKFILIGKIQQLKREKRQIDETIKELLKRGNNET